MPCSDLAHPLRKERLRTALGGDEADQVNPATVAEILGTNPAAFGLAETPPAVAAIIRGPASPDEALILKTALGETAALLAEPRVTLNPAIRPACWAASSLAWTGGRTLSQLSMTASR
jgi:hypothetical protein